MKKRYGQHFLSDRNILQRIVRLAGIGPDDTVLEIGPGAGALTRELAAAAARDRDRSRSRSHSQASRAHAWQRRNHRRGCSRNESRRSGAFLPSCRQPSLQHRDTASEAIHRPRAITFSTSPSCCRRKSQSVSAQVPGSGSYGPLSLLIQYYATPIRLHRPTRGFHPATKVDSAVIRLEWKPGVPDAKDFTDFVQLAFGSRRKKLLNNLVTIIPFTPARGNRHNPRSRRPLPRRSCRKAHRRAIPTCV